MTTLPKSPDDAIAEINARLREAAIGYQYEGDRIVRVDSAFVHSEVTVPALALLLDERFESANREFREAHSAYRGGDYEECLHGCAKAFESVLKVIAAKRGWDVKEADPAKRLIDAAYAAGFIPSVLQAEFTALRSLLEAGVPVLRNKMAGHGAGTEKRVVPEHFAAFQLHQTAAVILFLVKQDEG